jgi:hypothetical protein
MMKEPVVVVPKSWSFSSHIFFQASQNVTVKVDCNVRRNKFMVNNSLHVEKNNQHALFWPPDLRHLFCCWWLWSLSLRRLLFCLWIITINPTFVTHYYPRDKSRVLVSLLSYLKTQFTLRCFWSFVKSRGTNFTAVWHMFTFSVEISWQTP